MFFLDGRFFFLAPVNKFIKKIMTALPVMLPLSNFASEFFEPFGTN